MGLQAQTIRFDNDDKQWNQHKAAEMAKFNGASVVVFFGHGLRNARGGHPGGPTPSTCR